MANPTIYAVRSALTIAVASAIEQWAIPAINASLAASYEAQGVPAANWIQFGPSQVRRGNMLVTADPTIDVYMGQFKAASDGMEYLTVTHWTNICLKMIVAAPLNAVSSADTTPEDYEMVRAAFVDTVFDVLSSGPQSFALNPNLSPSVKPLPSGTNFTGCYVDGGGPLPVEKTINPAAPRFAHCMSHRATINYPLNRPLALGFPE